MLNRLLSSLPVHQVKRPEDGQGVDQEIGSPLDKVHFRRQPQLELPGESEARGVGEEVQGGPEEEEASLQEYLPEPH